MMGSGAEAVEETVEHLIARGEKVGVVKVRLYRPFSVEHFVAALPPTVKTHRGARPHEGAGRDRRAAVPRRRRRAAARPDGRVDAARRRRPLRAVVEGVHAGDGQGGLRRAGEATADEPLHRRHRRRRDAHQPRLRPGLLDRGAGRRCARVLRPRRRRHGRGEQELDQDHRRGDRQLRPGLLRLRLEEVRLGDRLAPALRAAADPLDAT